MSKKTSEDASCNNEPRNPMAPKKILVDALYPDDVRIAILDEYGRLVDLVCQNPQDDLYAGKSDICLGTISRVEHALQAAFVDYGCEKSGFLPFSDIHPYYYQIPSFDQKRVEKGKHTDQDTEDSSANEEDEYKEVRKEQASSKRNNGYNDYKIQEVIRRGQNVLVQICRDEIGNKGAALTTYISLAGRYCILMPNTPNGISMSHRITEPEERKRLTSIAKTFSIPSGMSVLLRTAAQDEDAETLHRDYKYLMDLWDNIRERTLKSKTMSVIYTEEKVIKQIMRDYYNDSIEQIVVSGQDGYEKVLECFANFAPEDKHKVVYYEDKVPLLTKYNVDRQINELFSVRVNLPSGGYLVINQTEALVAIDVNSGKATSEKNVEDTALNINLEAAVEIARQIRLRGLGGLIIIDFIDMAKVQNRKTVESCLYEHMYHDKAKVKFTGISPFGLLEISRQRLRSSFVEANTSTCTACTGSGRIKLPSYITNMIMRSIETQKHRIAGNHGLEIICSKIVVESLRKKMNAHSKKMPSELIITANEDNNIPPDFFSLRVKDKEEGSFKEIFRYDQDSLNQAQACKTASEIAISRKKMEETSMYAKGNKMDARENVNYRHDNQNREEISDNRSSDGNRVVRRNMPKSRKPSGYGDWQRIKPQHRSRRNSEPNKDMHRKRNIRGAQKKAKPTNFFVAAIKKLLNKF